METASIWHLSSSSTQLRQQHLSPCGNCSRKVQVHLPSSNVRFDASAPGLPKHAAGLGSDTHQPPPASTAGRHHWSAHLVPHRFQLPHEPMVHACPGCVGHLVLCWGINCMLHSLSHLQSRTSSGCTDHLRSGLHSALLCCRQCRASRAAVGHDQRSLYDAGWSSARLTACSVAGTCGCRVQPGRRRRKQGGHTASAVRK